MKIKAKYSFSLLEITISLIIISLCLIGFTELLYTKKYYQYIHETKSQLRTLSDAIQSYTTMNGHLPCPAAIALTEHDPQFGISADCTNPTALLPLTYTYSSETIYMGMVPFQTLGIPRKQAYDKWGRRITYVIPNNMATSPNAFKEYLNDINTKTIIIKRNFSGVGTLDVYNNIPTISYLLLSHGFRGIGAYNTVGEVGDGKACQDFNSIETQNCTLDNVFIEAQMTPSHNPQDDIYYDDIVLWQTHNSMLVHRSEKQNNHYNKYINAVEDITYETTLSSILSQAPGKYVIVNSDITEIHQQISTDSNLPALAQEKQALVDITTDSKILFIRYLESPDIIYKNDDGTFQLQNNTWWTYLSNQYTVPIVQDILYQYPTDPMNKGLYVVQYDQFQSNVLYPHNISYKYALIYVDNTGNSFFSHFIQNKTVVFLPNSTLMQLTDEVWNVL